MLIRQFLLTQNCLEVVLYLRGTGADRFWPRAPAPAPAGARSETARQFLRWTFKFTSNEEEKEEKNKPKRRHRKWESLCHFFSPKNNSFFSVKISVFWLFVSCFPYECRCVSFSHWFFFFFPSWHTPPSAPRYTPTPPKTHPNEVTCTKKDKKTRKTGERQ